MFEIVDTPLGDKKNSKSSAIGETKYMGAKQLCFFRDILKRRKTELVAQTAPGWLQDSAVAPDPVDRAALEIERSSAVSSIERAWQQIREIDLALARMESGDYGFCEDTGAPIGFDRLVANPTARYTVEAMSVREKRASRFA